MKRAAVIGHPIKHSLSPMIHNHWIKKYGIDGSYEAIDIAPEDLRDTLAGLIAQGYAGFNVTIPHKVAVMDLCDEIDDVAKAIGAVNTICIENGKVYGTNTDAFGFIENLREQQPEWHPEGAALILGAGGAAKAIVYALQQAGVKEIVVSNRTREKAEELGVTTVDWQDRNRKARDTTLIINTTSLGMVGQEALDIDLSGANAIVYDIVYRPLITPLLSQAEGLGLPAVTGLGMLLHQARPAFKGWFNLMPDVDNELQDMVLKAAQ